MNEMEKTALSAGIKTIGKHKAAQLLALCMAVGDEPFVFSQKLHDDTITASQMYGLYGMGVPDREVVELIKIHINELFFGDARSWVTKINEQYDTLFPYHVSPITRGKELWQSMHT